MTRGRRKEHERSRNGNTRRTMRNYKKNKLRIMREAEMARGRIGEDY